MKEHAPVNPDSQPNYLTRTALNISVFFGRPGWVKTICEKVGMDEERKRMLLAEAHSSAAHRREVNHGDMTSDKYRYHLSQAARYRVSLESIRERHAESDKPNIFGL